MDILLKKYYRLRPFLVYNYIKSMPSFYIKSSIHQRINLKSRLDSFFLNSLIYRYKQPY